MLGIAMVLLGGAILGIDSLKTQYQTQVSYENAKDEGAFLPFPSKSHHDVLFSEYYDNFKHEDRRYFPKEYHAYLEKNIDALACYAQGLAFQQEIKEGNAPYGICGYNKYTFNPFSRFHAVYDEKIKVYNEKGLFCK